MGDNEDPMNEAQDADLNAGQPCQPDSNNAKTRQPEEKIFATIATQCERLLTDHHRVTDWHCFPVEAMSFMNDFYDCSLQNLSKTAMQRPINNEEILRECRPIAKIVAYVLPGGYENVPREITGSLERCEPRAIDLLNGSASDVEKYRKLITEYQKCIDVLKEKIRVVSANDGDADRSETSHQHRKKSRADAFCSAHTQTGNRTRRRNSLARSRSTKRNSSQQNAQGRETSKPFPRSSSPAVLVRGRRKLIPISPQKSYPSPRFAKKASSKIPDKKNRTKIAGRRVTRDPSPKNRGEEKYAYVHYDSKKRAANKSPRRKLYLPSNSCKADSEDVDSSDGEDDEDGDEMWSEAELQDLSDAQSRRSKKKIRNGKVRQKGKVQKQSGNCKSYGDARGRSTAGLEKGFTRCDTRQQNAQGRETSKPFPRSSSPAVLVRGRRKLIPISPQKSYPSPRFAKKASSKIPDKKNRTKIAGRRVTRDPSPKNRGEEKYAYVHYDSKKRAANKSPRRKLYLPSNSCKADSEDVDSSDGEDDEDGDEMWSEAELQDLSDAQSRRSKKKIRNGKVRQKGKVQKQSGNCKSYGDARGRSTAGLEKGFTRCDTRQQKPVKTVKTRGRSPPRRPSSPFPPISRKRKLSQVYLKQRSPTNFSPTAKNRETVKIADSKESKDDDEQKEKRKEEFSEGEDVGVWNLNCDDDEDFEDEEECECECECEDDEDSEDEEECECECECGDDDDDDDDDNDDDDTDDDDDDDDGKVKSYDEIVEVDSDNSSEAQSDSETESPAPKRRKTDENKPT